MTSFLSDKSERLFSDEIFRLFAPCMYRPTPEKYRARMRRWISDPYVEIRLLEEDGAAVGILVLDRSAEIPEILGIAAAEDRRGQGIGRDMLRRLTEELRPEKLQACTDSDAVGFYRKMGFTAVPEVREYPDGPALRWRCVLTSGAQPGPEDDLR